MFTQKNGLAISLAIVWIASALLPLHPLTYAQGMDALAYLKLDGSLSHYALWAGVLTDLMCAFLAIFVNRRWAWLLQAIIVFIYTILLTISQWQLWLHPFGPLLKNLPILAICLYLAQRAHHE